MRFISKIKLVYAVASKYGLPVTDDLIQEAAVEILHNLAIRYDKENPDNKRKYSVASCIWNAVQRAGRRTAYHHGRWPAQLPIVKDENGEREFEPAVEDKTNDDADTIERMLSKTSSERASVVMDVMAGLEFWQIGKKHGITKQAAWARYQRALEDFGFLALTQ